MAGWMETTLTARSRNKTERGVHEVSSYHMATYWANSHQNFYIAGGDPERRRRVLLSKLTYDAVNRRPELETPLHTIILAKSDKLARELISLQYDQNIFTSLTVSGVGGDENTGANYQPLYGVGPAEIGKFLHQVLRERNSGNNDAVIGLIQSITQIAAAAYPGQCSLQLIDWLLRLELYQIERIAVESHVSSNEIDRLRGSTEAMKSLAALTESLYESMKHLTNRNCSTHLNLVERVRNDAGAGGVTLIESTSADQWLVNALLAAELSQLARENYRLILFEANVEKDDDIYKKVFAMRGMGMPKIGVCYENPSLFLGDDGISGFNNHVFLGRSGLPEKNQRELLSYEGEFRVKTVERDLDGRRRHHTLFPQYEMKEEKELRVTPRDMANREAMLKDSNNRLIVVSRKLHI